MKRLYLLTLLIMVFSFSLIAQQNENDPLVLINGKASIQDVSLIDPENVESLSVLKDQTALNLYGKAGKNGVILVETKDKPATDTSSEPLVVVNEEFYTSDLNTIDTDDIESIEVIKGEKAKELYGILGKNGVILVTTSDHSSNRKE